MLGHMNTFHLLLTCCLATGTLCAAAPKKTAPAAKDKPAAAQAVDKKAKLTRDAKCRQVLAECTVNGKKAIMMLDTGASHTVLAKSFVEKSIPDAQKVDTSQMTANSNSARQQMPDIYQVQLGVNGKKLEHYALCLPLDGVQQSMATPIDGILGIDVLGDMEFTFDLREGGEGCYWGLPKDVDGMAVMEPLRVDRLNRPVMLIDTGTKETPHQVALLLDTGASVTCVLPKDWPAGAEAEEKTVGVADVNGAAKATVKYGKPVSVSLAKGVKVKMAPQLQGGNADGIIGMDALEGLRFAHRGSGSVRFLISK